MDKLMKKVEGLDSTERDKLRKLLKEKSSAEDDPKMDWMYKEDKPEQEEYLLGRKVDKYIENTTGRNDDLGDIPGALFTVDDDVVSRRADIDMQTKMREDPLYAIKEKEKEAKRKLLQNPIKMKKLEQLVNEREEQLQKLKRRKEKKQKKSKKKKKGSRSDSSDSSSSDDELINKYLAIVREKEDKSGERSKNQDSKERDSHRHSGRGGDSRDRDRPGRRDSSRERDESGSSKWKGDSRGRYGLVSKRGPPSRSRRSRSNSTPERSRSRRSRSRSNSPPERSRSRRSRSRSNSPPERSRSRRSRSPKRERQKRHSPPRREEPKRKLTAAEMEERRRAMQANAKQRDLDREANVKRYKEEDEKEKEALQNLKPGEAGFVKPMMMKHADNSSVEDRIKRNIYNIQRTSAALDKKFTKH